MVFRPEKADSRRRARPVYIDADLKPVMEALDTLWLSGRAADLATIAQYAAHRVADCMNESGNRLGEQVAEMLGEEALALSLVTQEGSNDGNR